MDDDEGMYDKPVYITLAIPFTCCLGLFFGLFFGLNYPEIRINQEYLESYGAANVTSHSWKDKVCCSTSMGHCSTFASGQSCSGIVSKYEANDGQQYLQQAHAGDNWYPKSCRGGSCCVEERCETCTRQSCTRRSLPLAKSKRSLPLAKSKAEFNTLSFVEGSSASTKSDGSRRLLQGAGGGGSSSSSSSYDSRRRTCTTETYSCNCVCVMHGNYQSSVSCGVCYSATVNLRFYQSEEHKINKDINLASISKNFERSRSDMDHWLKVYADGTSHTIYYDPENPSAVVSRPHEKTPMDHGRAHACTQSSRTWL